MNLLCPTVSSDDNNNTQRKSTMASTTTQRRKAPKSLDGVLSVPTKIAVKPDPPAQIAVATVKRNKCGTSPFDENWLNMDCCGLFCAGITYGLHFYGVYAVCLVLLPPWMSTTDEDGVRSLTFMGHFHRMAFTWWQCWQLRLISRQ